MYRHLSLPRLQAQQHQLMRNGTTIQYFYVPITLVSKFIHYVCKMVIRLYFNALKHTIFLLIQALFFSFVIEWFTLLLLYDNDSEFPFFYRVPNLNRRAIRIRRAGCSNCLHYKSSQHSGNRMIDIYQNWNKNMEMKWVSLLSVDPGYPFLLKKKSQIYRMQSLSLHGDSWDISRDQGLFISVYTFNQVLCSIFSEIQSLSLSKAFGSNELRWIVIKIYASHSDSHPTVTAIATCQLPIHFPTDDNHLHSSHEGFNVHLETV